MNPSKTLTMVAQLTCHGALLAAQTQNFVKAAAGTLPPPSLHFQPKTSRAPASSTPVATTSESPVKK